MRWMASRAMMVLGAVACVSATETTVTPVQKVIQMLNNMMAKGTQEKKDEQVAFSAFSQWCQDVSADKERRIQSAEQTMEQLNADILKASADIDRLNQEMTDLEGDMATWQGDMKAASSVRQQERTDYSATHADYSESIDAIGRAVITLKNQAHDRKQIGSALLQVQALAMVDQQARKTISSFLSTVQEPEGVSVQAPEANAYEFQSGGVVEMLEKLGDKFKGELTTLEREELTTHHGYQVLMQDLTGQIEAAKNQHADKGAQRGQRQQDKARAEGDLVETTTARDEDVKYLKDLKQECASKSSDFESRQKLRAEELEALAQAVEILGSGDVSGNADKHLPALVATSSSFAQLRASKPNSIQGLQQKIAAFLKQRGSKLKSRALAMLALKVGSTEEDVFKQVKKMIQELVVRLMEEANQEAETKGWCDTELATNKVTRQQKAEDVEKLTAAVEGLTAEGIQLQEDLADLAAAISQLDKAVAEATTTRTEEKARNTATIADAKDSQKAVEQALTILKEFYARAVGATALMQAPSEDAPTTFSGAYTGQQGSSGGVVGMIEVILSDFVRLESETSAAEELARSTFVQFSHDSDMDKQIKLRQTEHKETRAQEARSDLASHKKELEGTQTELDAASAYYEKLQPSCVDSGVSYEERVQQRKDEIQSLREALDILQGEF